MLEAAFKAPLPGIKGIPQRFIAEMVYPFRIYVFRTIVVPVGSADYMTGKAQGFDFIFSPEGKLALLQADIVHTGKITKGERIYSPGRKSVGIALRAHMAEPLDAHHHLIQQSPVPARPEHRKTVRKLRAPNMDHIRTECIQSLSKHTFQLR